MEVLTYLLTAIATLAAATGLLFKMLVVAYKQQISAKDEEINRLQKQVSDLLLSKKSK